MEHSCDGKGCGLFESWVLLDHLCFIWGPLFTRSLRPGSSARLYHKKSWAGSFCCVLRSGRVQLLRKCLFNTQTIGEFRSDPCMRSHLTELLTLCCRSVAMKHLKEEAESAESPIVVGHMPKTCVNVWNRDGASSVHADAFLYRDLW